MPGTGLGAIQVQQHNSSPNNYTVGINTPGPISSSDTQGLNN